MNRSAYTVVIILAALITLGIAFSYGTQRDAEVSEINVNIPATTSPAIISSQGIPNSPAQTLPQTGSTGTKTYTLAEIAKHNSQTSCFTAIGSSVYDLTSWIAKHPGGPEAILYICGIDGTEIFSNQHGGQPRPEQVLASFRIGALVK